MKNGRPIDPQMAAAQKVSIALEGLGMKPLIREEDCFIRILCDQKVVAVIGDITGLKGIDILILDSSELGCSAKEFIERLGFFSNECFRGCVMSIVR